MSMSRAKPSHAGKGRPKGSLNKVTGAAKAAIEMAAEGIGGSKRLQAWCKEDPLNERAFWTQIYTKLLPLQLTGDEGKPLIPPSIAFLVQQQDGAENQT